MAPLLQLPILLSLVWFFLAIPPTVGDGQTNFVRLEMLHRYGTELLERRITPENRHEHVKELVFFDQIRKKMISERLGGGGGACRRKATEMAMVASLSSGAYARTGLYFVRFRVGTPAKEFLLVADTGSDLTWMKCQYQCRNCTNSVERRRRRVFIGDKSSSFSPIECSSTACKNKLTFALTECPNPNSPCAYAYEYADGSKANGFFANETSTVTLSSGEEITLKGVVIGCSTSFVGSSFRVADGVLGLAYSEHSFPVKAAGHFGGIFSYCLVYHLSPKNTSNYLTFGALPTKPALRYTPLIADAAFYWVQVTGISVGGVLLQKIPPAVWTFNSSGGGGTILDSGSSLTSLAEPAYRAVLAAISAPLRVLEKVEVDAFEFCFREKGYSEAMVPRLAIHLDGAGEEVRFEPHVNSYVIDLEPGVKCIGLLPVPWPGGISIIGNILQQDFMWEFDVANGRLGFAPTNCALHNS